MPIKIFTHKVLLTFSFRTFALSCQIMHPVFPAAIGGDHTCKSWCTGLYNFRCQNQKNALVTTKPRREICFIVCASAPNVTYTGLVLAPFQFLKPLIPQSTYWWTKAYGTQLQRLSFSVHVLGGQGSAVSRRRRSDVRDAVLESTKRVPGSAENNSDSYNCVW